MPFFLVFPFSPISFGCAFRISIGFQPLNDAKLLVSKYADYIHGMKEEKSENSQPGIILSESINYVAQVEMNAIATMPNKCNMKPTKEKQIGIKKKVVIYGTM